MTIDNGRVTLAIDYSRPIRSRGLQEQLVQAVIQARPTEQETEFIEWKSTVDLGEKGWQAEIARHVLGFANRDPDLAKQQFGGCAYIVIGASPDQSVGTPVYDVAKLDTWLSAYVGKTPDCPQWSATYVSVQGANHLLLTVEPPEWADPIWSLRNEYTPVGSNVPWRRGTVFVRRRGSTEQAEQADYAMLGRRSSGEVKRLDLGLRLESEDRIVAVDTRPEAIEQWLATEKQSLRRPDPPKPKQIDPLAGASVAAQIADSMRATNALVGNLESRSRSEYDAEVEQYIEKARPALPIELMRRCVQRQHGLLRLWLVNNTEHNFAEVAVELHFPQPGVQTYLDAYDAEGPDMPRRPDGWRSRKISDVLGSTYLSPGFGYSGLSADIPTRRGHVDNGGSSTIRFAPVDVRPSHRHRLEDVYVVVPEDMAGLEVEATWFATATDTSGTAEGELMVAVAEEVKTPEDLMAM